LISGSESALASAVLGTASDSSQAAADMSGNFLLSRLLVSLKANATVGQVNAAARVIGATRITSSESGSSLIVLEVPRQADVATIQRLAKTMRGQAGVAFAWPGETAASTVLPEASPGTPVAVESVAHLRGNRFPQSWNARQAFAADCLPRSVTVYVMDKFGPDSARPHFFDEVDRSSFIVDPNGMSTLEEGHGYDVVSTLAANFDAETPTGADPFADCVIVHAIEVKQHEQLDAIRRAARLIAADADPRVILTSSLVFKNDEFCGINGDQPCTATSVPATVPEFPQGELAARAVIAAEWARLVRQHGLADKVLLTQSAGNVHELPEGFLEQNYLGFRSAKLASVAALATHLVDLKALLTDASLWKSATTPTLPDFTFSDSDADSVVQIDPSLDPDNSLDPANLLIVDSGSSAETLDTVTQSSFDYLGANVRAVGEDVPLNGQVVDGTSFSTPLVAGLAAYLWNLSPELAAKPTSATVDLLKRSSRTTASSPTVPVIDAYAAVLRLDTAGSVSPPIRLGLLDVNADGVFDALDLQKFATAYGLANPNTPTIPTARDFSRFDLNGDGFTGGIPIAAFDLDINLDSNGQPVINSTDAEIESYQLSFNEAALSDLQILCYYAYSPMYQSDDGGQNDQLRTTVLGPDHCVGARMDVQLPAQIAAPTSMTVHVDVPAGHGNFAAAPNVLVELTPTCASVNPSSGRTDANGSISTILTPAPGCTSATLQATARADAGTSILASQSATTTIAGAARTSYSTVVLTQLGGPPGVLRASFNDIDPTTLNLVPIVQFTAPVSDVANFMSRVRETLVGIGEIGFLSIQLVDEGLPIQLDLPGVTVGELGVRSSCNSTVNVTVGDARPNIAGTTFTHGELVAAGCGTVTIRAAAVVSLNIADTNNLSLNLRADSVSSGLNIGSVQAVIASTLDLTVGFTGIFSIRNTRDSTLRIQGSASADLALIGNRNLTLGATLDSSGLTRDLIVDNNTFNGPSLTQLQVGAMRNLTITNNFGFSNADARSFANAHAISGTTTIGNNQP
jgi:hypothetical protein